MSFKTIKIGINDGIGKIAFNRPDVLNAYNLTLSKELKHGLNILFEDNAAKVIAITGSGKAFMAGADINMVSGWISQGAAEKIRMDLDDMFNPNMLEKGNKPTIAAVNGLAYGMGCEIAMACDFRIAANTASFALPEIKLGILPGGGGSQRMLRLVGETKALELIATGDPIDASEAHRIGLTNMTVEPEKLWDGVVSFAGRLKDKGGMALSACKKMIYDGGNLSLYKGIEYERDRFCEILLTTDAAEGTQAFLEKRKPEFTGK